MKTGQELDVQIDKFANRGKSLTRVDGFVIFVRGAVPGDRMHIRITESKKSYAEAEPVELIEASPRRAMPRCVYADICGGCQWQHVSYEAQLELKEEAVRDALKYTGGLDLGNVDMREAIPADSPFYYRNKMTFAFSTDQIPLEWKSSPAKTSPESLVLGLHPRGRYDTVVDLHECHLQSPLSVRIVNSIRSFCSSRGWTASHPDTGRGFLKQLIVRMGARTEDLMVYLITDRHESDRLTALATYIRESFPAVTTFVHGVDTPPGPSRDTTVLFGDGVLRERLDPYLFTIGPETFFQPNTRGAERLYRAVARLGEFSPSDRIYDLYCGIGSLSLFLSRRVRDVIGIEVDEDAVRLARKNARSNNVSNCRFRAGRVQDQLHPASEGDDRPHVVVCDPPRAGLAGEVVERIIRLRPDRLVYVSCDPQTQARDLKRLSHAYTLDVVQPVDLFPQTYHVENIAKLSVKS